MDGASGKGGGHETSLLHVYLCHEYTRDRPMKHQEQKYRVDNFDPIVQKLTSLGAQPGHESTSTHYYAVVPGNDVVKVVAHADQCEVHKLSETDGGKFVLTDRFPVADVKAGLKWLKDQGYTQVSTVAMRHTDYEYAGGLVGLYDINGELKSLILDYPAGEHDAMAQALGVVGAERIEVPYNIYLEQRGLLNSADIEALL